MGHRAGGLLGPLGGRHGRERGSGPAPEGGDEGAQHPEPGSTQLAHRANQAPHLGRIPLGGRRARPPGRLCGGEPEQPIRGKMEHEAQAPQGEDAGEHQSALQAAIHFLGKADALGHIRLGEGGSQPGIPGRPPQCLRETTPHRGPTMRTGTCRHIPPPKEQRSTEGCQAPWGALKWRPAMTRVRRYCALGGSPRKPLLAVRGFRRPTSRVLIGA